MQIVNTQLGRGERRERKTKPHSEHIIKAVDLFSALVMHFECKVPRTIVTYQHSDFKIKYTWVMLQ